MQKSLDRKLNSIHNDPSGSKEFIIADAKDADMAFGLSATGEYVDPATGQVRNKTLGEYRDQIREVIAQGIVDIVLMSASTAEKLAIEEKLFENSLLTPAARGNDTTDVHIPRGGTAFQEASFPFRSASIDHMMSGKLDPTDAERKRGVDLALYSITFNNNRDLDLHALEQYKLFREEAERKGFRHFLELFDPNLPGAVPPEQVAGFINDQIVRTLGGVTSKGRPVFLKMVYHGPQAMEELVAYDPHLVVGVLGGAAGTTLDAFTLLHEAKKYGGRAALFGRKINQAEHQLAFIQFLRHLADGLIEPVEAVKAYHGVLEKLNIKPRRTLEEDLTLQTSVMSYGGSGTTISIPKSSTKLASVKAATWKPTEKPVAKPAAKSVEKQTASAPDFNSMSSDERLKYHQDRLANLFG
ncbi:hypothetical protein Pla110_05850 [Polystyrenella longa]|uniref:Fructose-bisphosphate aldolase n=1 Tax=Polystyrenella longa TaxID=2528007 RepID=A0A518CI38_9PLAN|nr:hypothetical protein [Polystyrenella longa]QDU78881.1 hypothetical protein Pla110_05850 [Polystyrenella longa]